MPATFKIAPGPLYRFDGITVSGTEGVRPSFIQKRLQRLQGKVYDPALIDSRFRELIETGCFGTCESPLKRSPGTKCDWT